MRCLVPMLLAGLLSVVLPRAELAHAATFTVTDIRDAPHTPIPRAPQGRSCWRASEGSPPWRRGAASRTGTARPGPRLGRRVVVPMQHTSRRL